MRVAAAMDPLSKLRFRLLDGAGASLSGIGEYGLANQLWAVCGRMNECARLGHVYVRDPETGKCAQPQLHENQ